MSAIITFIKTVSASAIVLAAVNILGLKGKMEKSFKYALGLFSVSVLIFAGATALSGNFDIGADYSTPTVAEANTDMNNASLSYALGQILNKNGIKYSEISVNTDILEDGSINITKAVICCDSGEDFIKAYSLILKETGIKITEG